MSIQEEYLQIINSFIEATSGQKLTWRKQNPTTLFTETRTEKNETAVLSLQKVTRNAFVREQNRTIRKMLSSFVFVVKNKNTNELVLQIDSSNINDPNLKERIESLFSVAEYSSEQKNMDFLKGILGGIKNDVK